MYTVRAKKKMGYHSVPPYHYPDDHHNHHDHDHDPHHSHHDHHHHHHHNLIIGARDAVENLVNTHLRQLWLRCVTADDDSDDGDDGDGDDDDDDDSTCKQ